MFLVGTYNKQSGYTRSPFLDLHYRLAHALQHSNYLVIAGYGWGDDGINAHIYDWMGSSTYNEIINIDPSFKKVQKRTTSRAALAFYWWNKENRLKVIEREFEKMSWAEIRSQFQH